MDMPLLKSFTVDEEVLASRLEPFRALPHVAGEYLDFSLGVFTAQKLAYTATLEVASSGLEPAEGVE